MRLKQTAIGLNFIDVYHRLGLYPLELPSGLGLEGAAVVEAVSNDVTEFKAGDRVKEITNGKGVPVVYDSVGKDTWEGSLDSLCRRGMIVSFGNASGPVDLFQPALLSSKGSLFLTRPTSMDYTAERVDLLSSANELFEVVNSGAVKITINQTYPLTEAAQAHPSSRNGVDLKSVNFTQGGYGRFHLTDFQNASLP